MALTKTINTGVGVQQSLQGMLARGMKIEFGEIAMDSSYPTGGEAITFPAFKSVAAVFIQPKGGYVFDYDIDNAKVLAYYAATSANPFNQVSNTADLSALSNVPYLAIGF